MDVQRAIEAALDEIRPLIQADGGSIEFVSFEGGQVRVRLAGACTSCVLSAATLKLGVETHLKQAMPFVKEVVAVE